MQIAAIRQILTPLYRAMNGLVSRAVLRLANDSKKLQLVQLGVLDGETRNEVERFQNYGFTSVPKEGAEAVVIFAGGDRDHGLCIAVDDRRYRLKDLGAGEVAVYNDAGARILLKASGEIELTPKPGQIISLAGGVNPIAKGDQLNTAITTLGSAIAAAVTAMGGGPGGAALPMVGAVATAAGTAITTAVASFSGSATSALSTKVKLS